MQCAISGETPQDPVISSKSGNVFEKRLIEAYISENGKDPITGEETTVDDLIDVKTSRIVRPRPPTLTSIPSLLSVFQNEWDALALDSYTVRQQLSQTRQELATALYQHDAAIRVITRLTKERDDARDALSKVTVGAGASNGDSMQVDSDGPSEELLQKIDATQEKLSKSRRKRPVPKDWATSDDIESLSVSQSSKPLYNGSLFIAVDSTGEQAIVGGADGEAGVYSIKSNEILQTLNVGGKIMDAVWYGNDPVIASSSGAVKVFKDGQESTTFSSHSGSVTALAMHPCGELVASTGLDKSFVFYDLTTNKSVMQVYTECMLTMAAFHPDGHLFAAGAIDGKVKMYHTKTGEFAAMFDCDVSVRSLSFSENGIWFAAVAQGSTSVRVFDLRKEGSAAEVKAIDVGGVVDFIQWDYTGQFLATAGPNGITVQHYTKASKVWSEPLRSATPAISLAWTSEAHKLLSVSEGGVISVLEGRSE